jgi:hypothetical protein
MEVGFILFWWVKVEESLRLLQKDEEKVSRRTKVEPESSPLAVR